MEQLTPGRFGSIKSFREQFGEPAEGNMRELYSLVFESKAGLPPVALRRLKGEVARDLPEKSRRLHPRLMPEPQAATYEKARGNLAAGSQWGAEDAPPYQVRLRSPGRFVSRGRRDLHGHVRPTSSHDGHSARGQRARRTGTGLHRTHQNAAPVRRAGETRFRPAAGRSDQWEYPDPTPSGDSEPVPATPET